MMLLLLLPVLVLMLLVLWMKAWLERVQMRPVLRVSASKIRT